MEFGFLPIKIHFNSIVSMKLYLYVGNDEHFRACVHGDGGPQVGEVTRLGGVTCLSILSLILITVTCHMLLHLSVVPHLNANRPLFGVILVAVPWAVSML